MDLCGELNSNYSGICRVVAQRFNLRMDRGSKTVENQSTGGFPGTRWSVVLDAQGENQEALSLICGDYWFPIYTFARRSGYSADDAEDITQGFFHHFVTSDFIQKASESRGRLRSFLLVSFRNYCRQEWRKETAKKRGGDEVQMPIQIDGVMADSRFELEISQQLRPEIEFDRAWAREILARAQLRLEDRYKRLGKQETYRILSPHIGGNEQPYREIALSLGCDAPAARYTIFKMREQFRKCVEETVRDTVQTDEDAAIELAYLQRVFRDEK